MRKTSLVSVCLCVVAVSACTRNAEQAKRDYIERGDKYASENNLDAAIIEYRNAIQRDPKFAEAYQKLATTYVSRGDGPNALRNAVIGADLSPDSTDAQLQAGNLLLVAGKFDDAKARAEKALAGSPQNSRARVLLASAMAGLKDVDTAVKELEEAIRLDPKQATAYASLAVLKAGQGDRAGAEKTFQQAIAADPSSVSARLALAQFYWVSGRTAEAEAGMKEAIKVSPSDHRANGLLSVFYQLTGRAAEAEPYLRTAAGAEPTGAATIRLADYYVAQNRRAEATPLLNRVKPDGKFGPIAGIRLAELAQLDGRPDEAISIIDGVIKTDPKNVMALSAKADLLRRQRKLEDASKAADAAIAADRMSPSAKLARGRVLVAQGHLAEAEQAFQETLQLSPRAAAPQVELARLHVRTGASDSVELATKAAKADPGSLSTRLTLVRALAQRRDYAQAQEMLKVLLKAAPESPSVHALMGTVLIKSGDAAGARAEYDKALERDPLQLEAIEGLTSLDVKAQHGPAAIARLESLVERAPRNAGLLMLSAAAYASVKDLTRAEQALLEALEVDPGLMPAYGMLGRIYLVQNKLDAAKAQFEKVVAAQEKPVAALTMVGMIEQMQSRLPEAEQTFQKVLRLDPRAGVAANNLAWIYAERGANLDTALQLAQTAKAAMPDQPQVNDTLGWVYFKKDMLPMAISTLQHTLELDSNNGPASYHLALVYEKSGNRAEAKRLLQQSLKLNPTADFSADAKRRLETLGS
jgi:tetratricopeptide (TPR) repeat protein